MTAHHLATSRHGTVYYFRRRVPDDLRDALGRSSIVRTLATTNRREAVVLSRRLSVWTDSLFMELRKVSNTEQQHIIASNYSFELTGYDDQGRPLFRASGDKDEQECINAAIEVTMQSIPKAKQISRPSGPAMTFPEARVEFHKGKGHKEGTIGTHRSRLACAEKYFGTDRDILSIEQGEFSAYCAHVMKQGIDTATQGHYMTTCAAMLNFFRIRAGKQQLTTKTLIPAKETADEDERSPFTLNEVSILVKNAARYRIRQPAKFFVTIAPFLMGCRLEELCQIDLHSDLKHDKERDIWYIDINQNPDSDGKKRKSLKKPSAARLTPIHSTLIRLGFVSYLLDQRRRRYKRPFESQWKPRIQNETPKWSHEITKWGGNELKKLRSQGLVHGTRKTYFHSMRHTTINVLAKEGILEEMRAPLTGHVIGGENNKRYASMKREYVALSAMIEQGLCRIAKAIETAIH